MKAKSSNGKTFRVYGWCRGPGCYTAYVTDYSGRKHMHETGAYRDILSAMYAARLWVEAH